jgi:hypothetical protein
MWNAFASCFDHSCSRAANNDTRTLPPSTRPSFSVPVSFSPPRGAIAAEVRKMATAWPSLFWEMDALESQLQCLPHADKWFVQSQSSPSVLRESSDVLSPSSLRRGLFRFSSRSFSSRVLLLPVRFLMGNRCVMLSSLVATIRSSYRFLRLRCILKLSALRHLAALWCLNMSCMEPSAKGKS